MKKIDVFLLAAGESSRMFPLSTIMEKSLLPVNGVPVIRHIVDNLTQPEVAKHIRRIVICCLSKFKKQFEHEFRDMPSIEFKEFDEPEGTYGTWYDAATGDCTEWSMVHYADCITEIDYADFISKIDPKCHGLIAVTNTVKHDYSEVSFTVDGIVQDFVEKPHVMNYSWSGIGIFNTEELADYIDLDRTDFAFDIFPIMIKLGKLRAYPYNGKWIDVGNLNSYRKICNQYNGEK